MGVGHMASKQIPEKKTNFAMKSKSSIAGWIFGKQTMHGKGIKVMEFNIATWNVRSMLHARKMEETADVLKKYNNIYRFQNAFLRYPTPRLHCFLSSHWPSFRFLSFMAFLIPSI
jgi:hypothetical protein